jgi:hypothetical protein
MINVPVREIFQDLLFLIKRQFIVTNDGPSFGHSICVIQRAKLIFLIYRETFFSTF